MTGLVDQAVLVVSEGVVFRPPAQAAGELGTRAGAQAPPWSHSEAGAAFPSGPQLDTPL